jgi:formate hydrogenlyase subunit 3/multisubunit Na+/H+ antiporter MnhD subunit
MSERQKQSLFFRQLMQSESSETCQNLAARISHIEREERIIRLAIGWAFFIALLSSVGLAYSAVFVRDFFENAPPVSVHVFTVILMGSLIFLLGVLVFWFSFRRASNNLYHECRSVILQRPHSDR